MQRSKSHASNRSNTATSDTSNQRSAGNSNNNNLVNSNHHSNNISPNNDIRGESQQHHHQTQQQLHQQQNFQQQHKGLEWVIGLSIRVKTLTDEEYEGQIYAYDPKTSCVILQSPSAANPTNSNSNSFLKYDFRILKISFLKEVTHLPGANKPSVDGNSTSPTNNSTPTPTLNGTGMSNNHSTSVFSTTAPSVSHVQMDRIQARGLQAYKDTQAALAKIGVGVTHEAQEIFDALSKTLPCRWAKDSIVVLDEVIIHPPYDLENCKANSSASGSLARVKKVLEGEKKRLANVRKQPQQQSSLQPYNL